MPTTESANVICKSPATFVKVGGTAVLKKAPAPSTENVLSHTDRAGLRKIRQYTDWYVTVLLKAMLISITQGAAYDATFGSRRVTLPVEALVPDVRTRSGPVPVGAGAHKGGAPRPMVFRK